TVGGCRHGRRGAPPDERRRRPRPHRGHPSESPSPATAHGRTPGRPPPSPPGSPRRIAAVPETSVHRAPTAAASPAPPPLRSLPPARLAPPKNDGSQNPRRPSCVRQRGRCRRIRGCLDPSTLQPSSRRVNHTARRRTSPYPRRDAYVPFGRETWHLLVAFRSPHPHPQRCRSASRNPARVVHPQNRARSRLGLLARGFCWS